MKVEEIVQELESELRSVKESGMKQIPIEDFEMLVSEIARISKNTPNDISRETFTLEEYRARREDWLSRRDLRRRRDEKMPEYTIATGEHALKAVMTVNGAAAIALLAYFGSFAKNSAALPVPSSMVLALQFFVGGVLCAVIAFGSRFFSQAGFGSEFGPQSTKIGLHGRLFAIIFGALSLFSFGAGGFTSSQGLAEQVAAKAIDRAPAPKLDAERSHDVVSKDSGKLKTVDAEKPKVP